MKNLRIAFLFALLLLAGCGGVGSGTHVWIDVPIHNLRLAAPQPIKIEGHAASPEGVTLVEVWVNGDLVESISPTTTSTNLSAFETTFTPTSNGEYVIQVIATGRDDTTSTPDTAVVQIGELVEALPAEGETTPTTVPTEEVETQPPAATDPIVNYWADPAEIKAGDCTTLYWDITNVSQVVFGGREQEFSDSYKDCMCKTQTYPLKVTYLDGTLETFRVTINVTGSCATEAPAQDTTPPNPPTLLKPINGSTLPCSSDTMLRWSAATDSSGISEYRVKVERHSGDNNWKAVSGSVFKGITGLEKLLSIECGWTYRWRVRAIDVHGNAGNWSGWFTFIDPLI
jgi:hypothetical protein